MKVYGKGARQGRLSRTQRKQRVRVGNKYMNYRLNDVYTYRNICIGECENESLMEERLYNHESGYVDIDFYKPRKRRKAKRKERDVSCTGMV